MKVGRRDGGDIWEKNNVFYKNNLKNNWNKFKEGWWDKMRRLYITTQKRIYNLQWYMTFKNARYWGWQGSPDLAQSHLVYKGHAFKCTGPNQTEPILGLHCKARAWPVNWNLPIFLFITIYTQKISKLSSPHLLEYISNGKTLIECNHTSTNTLDGSH